MAVRKPNGEYVIDLDGEKYDPTEANLKLPPNGSSTTTK